MPRYSGPLVDAHHHYWEPGDGMQPWLLPDAAIPFRYGAYDAIKRDYLPADLAADAASAGFELIGSVTMETEWRDDDPLGEITHIESVAARFGGPSAAIGRVQLHKPGAVAVLEEMASHAIVRGVRHKPGQAASADQAATQPTLLSNPEWQATYAQLGRIGLDFELQTAWWHLDEAAALAAQHPEIPLTINHTALPSDRSAAGINGWAAAISRIAQLEHVWIKISGIGLPGTPWTVESNREIVERTVAAFGTDRVMFASNFPVDGLCGSYADIMGGFAEIAADWSPGEQYAAFAGNAIARYRLEIETQGAGSN